jgi:beta-lactam-binding protein with PASTA domain
MKEVHQPPKPPPDAWPIAEAPTVISHEDTIVVAPPEDYPPDRRIGTGMLLALGVVALLALGIVLGYLLTHRRQGHPVTTTVVTTAASAPSPAAGSKVAVPRLIGMQEQTALARLGQLGLRPKVIFQHTSTSNGLVVSQAPIQATKLANGSPVTLVITRTQTPTATATTTATTNASTTTASTTAPTTTAPAASPPPQNATMPDVVGENEAGAVQALSKVGILASLFFVPSQDPLGKVEQQAKAAGTTVLLHTHVQINLSKGPNDTTSAQVPNVIGQTLPQALSTLNNAHLRLIYLKLPITERAKAGTIVQQSPLGGGQAPQNAQILVYLGAYRTA